MDSLILSQIPLNELLTELRQVIKEEVTAAQQKQIEERLLSPAEACKLFVPAITRPTLEKLVMDGKLQKQYIGKRVFFSYKELISATKIYKRYEQS